ncbi:MAG: ThuA domain-containing protein [Clostridia bacterium]|nr:ThuA domain-containing protein [Clostridia bacterium]
MRITVWNENGHERFEEEIRALYPEGMHGCIANFYREAGHEVTTATLDMPEIGLPDELLDQTDVLVWWSHGMINEVPDEKVKKICDRVINDGMGLIVLHSGHASKIFRKLMGARSGHLKWRVAYPPEIDDKEIVWVVDQSHPIAQGIDEKFILEREEMYGEPTLIPAPDELVFLSWFSGGEVFRSGCTYKRGRGKIFYFRPGHESCPTFYDKNVQRVLLNAAEWAYTPPAKPYKYGWSAPVVE